MITESVASLTMQNSPTGRHSVARQDGQDPNPSGRRFPQFFPFFKRHDAQNSQTKSHSDAGNNAQDSSPQRRYSCELGAAYCAGPVVSFVRCCLCYRWPWTHISLGEEGLIVGSGGTSEVGCVNKAVYVNPVTARLLRVKTSAKVLELSEKNFQQDWGTEIGELSLKPTICYRVSDVKKFLGNVDDADKFVTSWVLRDVGYFLATSKSCREAITGLQRNHLRFSRSVNSHAMLFDRFLVYYPYQSTPA
ncbi:hypothetical protein BDW72DRAFT_188912 [Aspergillus terricola var. indicus]